MFCRWTLVVLAILFPTLAPAQEQKSITVFTGEWPPYVTEDDPQRGILSELLRLALAETGRRPTFEFLQFDVAKNHAHQRNTLTFPWFHAEADDTLWFVGKEPLLDVEYVFFFNKQNKSRRSNSGTLRDEFMNIKALDDLSHYRVGGVAGYNYRDQVADQIDKTGQRSADEFIAFRRLVNGEIDLLPASRRVGEYLLDNYFAESRYKIGQLPRLSNSRPIYVLASRSNAENKALMKDLDKALAKVKRDGALSRIETRYGARRKFDEVVRLQGNDKFPIVTGFENQADTEGYLIPNNSRAIVVDWGKGFLQTGPVDVPRQMFTRSRVRLLDGPLKGHELYVNSLFITFE